MASFQPSASTLRSSKSAMSLLSGSFNAPAVMSALYRNSVVSATNAPRLGSGKQCGLENGCGKWPTDDRIERPPMLAGTFPRSPAEGRGQMLACASRDELGKRGGGRIRGTYQAVSK